MKMHRSTLRYQKRPEDPVNQTIRLELVSLAGRHVAWGFPKLFQTLTRNGLEANHKRVERLYLEAGLRLPRKKRRRRRGESIWQRPHPAQGPNEVWTLDFVHDRTAVGTKLKILTVLDEGTRECLEIRVENRRLRAPHVIETLDELFHEYQRPVGIRMDNGPEFISQELSEFLREQGVKQYFIDPGSPWQNGFIESFNGKLRAECLNQEAFWSRAEAQVVVDWWRQVYNWERPHQSLGGQTPAEVGNRTRTGQSWIGAQYFALN